MTLTVSVAAATTGLTTRATLKTEFGITTTDEDAYLDTLISRVSARICSYLCVPQASNGTATLGRETLIETFPRIGSDGSRRSPIMLSRFPVVSISSVTEDSIAVTSGDYRLDSGSGMVDRLISDFESTWSSWDVVFTYVAGYLLPGDASRNLPYDIEEAAIALAKASRAARKRDPLAREIDVPGVQRVAYWVGGIGEGGSITPDIAAMIDPYRNIVV